MRLSPSGKIITHIDHTNIHKERRKLKSLEDLIDSNRLSITDIRQSYDSWRGYALKKDDKYLVYDMDLLYDDILYNHWSDFDDLLNYLHFQF